MSASFLVVDKPEGITSHDVVAILRAVTGVKKVGHTGTLDPFATGVLPVALGPATRLIQYLDEDSKVYDAVVKLGAATDTGDPTGTVIEEQPVPELDPQAVRQVLSGFLGTIMQEPPRYSAVKVKGKALYRYAREGADVRAEARPIRIDAIELLELEGDSMRLLITCGRGTYARVLADDVARALGTRGYLTALRRRQSGPFVEGQALGLPELSRMIADRDDWEKVVGPRRREERVPWKARAEVWGALQPRLLRPVDVLKHFAFAEVGDRRRVRDGGQLPAAPAGVAVGQTFLGLDGEEVVAVLQREPDGTRLVRYLA